MKRSTLAPWLLAMVLPLAAQAEGFSTADLGSTKDDPECLERSHLMFDKLSQTHQMGQVLTGVSNWSVIAFDITNEDYDAIVTCAYGPEGATRATLILYSNENTDHDFRDELARQMNEIWDQIK